MLKQDSVGDGPAWVKSPAWPDDLKHLIDHTFPLESETEIRRNDPLSRVCYGPQRYRRYLAQADAENNRPILRTISGECLARCGAVSYTHLRANEPGRKFVCRL